MLEERDQFEGLVNRGGREVAYRRRHAQVLLLVDEGEHGPGLIDWETAEQFGFFQANSRTDTLALCDRKLALGTGETQTQSGAFTNTGR